MKWESLLALVGNEAAFPSALLLAGEVSVSQVRLQLSRWVKVGRLLQLRRGVYALAPAWRKVEPHPFLVANGMMRGSYVSLQSALSFHGMIPEYVPVVTSVGPGRPETVRNPLGVFQYHHIAARLSYGYTRVEAATRQFAFVASPEKALLDLVYLTPGADSPEYLDELRLQNEEAIDVKRLMGFAARSGKPKLIRAARNIAKIVTASEGNRR
jgi:predicted transcriptional regulator of viral defense system